MSHSVDEQHQVEVKKGERFQFGKNWARFLTTLTDEKLSQAERSLQNALTSTRLDGKTFLDIGSGSGLFSLAARRLGATVHSFDYDSNSVACTQELKRRFFSRDGKWIIEQGSVLDRTYLAKLGTFDIVYSWGVLHHTGRMWTALDNVKTLVKPGGQLYVAIYNDLGATTDHWRTIKRTYNRLPSLLQLPFAMCVIGPIELRSIAYHLRHRQLRDYIRRWTHYDSLRGMSKWYDDIDWIGGYPYECATIEDLVDFFSKDGFALEWSLSRATGTGCNEIVFGRKADLGVSIDNPVPKSRFLIRRCGRRLSGPFRITNNGYVAKIPNALSLDALVLFHDGNLVGAPPAGDEAETIIIAPTDWSLQKLVATKIEVAPARVRKLNPPFSHYQGHMYGTSLPDLEHVADNTTSGQNISPVYIFEDKKQLRFPHALHADIAKFGAGRFSHWNKELLFSSSDNSDPCSNGRMYEIAIAVPNDV
jgi:2-polyprenyl-3-methyl-5-hydroxy-6-metoxy-1,4-benzoquinol methylase